MRNSILAGVVLGLAPLVAVASPAHAEFYSINDPADASGSLSDIDSLYVRHDTDSVVVRLGFDDLRRSSQAGMSVFIDTDRDRRGPEYVLGTGLGDGTDYALTRARRWRSVGEHLDCSYDARVGWWRDVFRTRMARDCFGNASHVRVSVKMVDPADPTGTVADWAPTRRHWTPWLETSA